MLPDLEKSPGLQKACTISGNRRTDSPGYRKGTGTPARYLREDMPKPILCSDSGAPDQRSDSGHGIEGNRANKMHTRNNSCLDGADWKSFFPSNSNGKKIGRRVMRHGNCR